MQTREKTMEDDTMTPATDAPSEGTEETTEMPAAEGMEEKKDEAGM